MKLYTDYKTPLRGKNKLYPRDIRNYIASITKEDKEVHDAIMSHSNKQPSFIFPLPTHNSFSILTYINDKKHNRMMSVIRQRISENPHIHIGEVEAEVENIFIKPFYFTRFKEGMYERDIKTPLVIASSDYEYALCRNMTNTQGISDKKALEKYVVDKIKEVIALTANHWFDETKSEEIADVLEDTIIIIKNIEYMAIKYKENEYYPAIKGTIISNKILPDFLGYKSGLGFGQLCSIHEMNKRKHRNNRGK